MLNPLMYLIIVIVVIYLIVYSKKKYYIHKHIISKRKGKDRIIMKELAEKFIGKDCLIYIMNSQVSGIIREVTDGAILIENNGKLEAVNLDFVIRIREYPLDKKGKRKSIILD